MVNLQLVRCALVTSGSDGKIPGEKTPKSTKLKAGGKNKKKTKAKDNEKEFL